MTRERILDAMAYVREDFLESAADSMRISARKRLLWKHIGAISASLLLAVGIFLFVQLGKTPDTISEHRILADADGPFGLGTYTDLEMRFGCGTDGFVYNQDAVVSMWQEAVEGRIVEILPALYTEPKTGERFHVLKLEVCDVIAGQNVPEILYFRLEEHLSTELLNFERFLIGMKQVGLERYPMYNEDEKRFESFSILFESSNAHGTEYGIFIPFDQDSGADLAVSDALWSLDGWNEAEISYLGGFERVLAQYPVKSGASLDETKETLTALYETSLNRYDYVYTISDFYNQDTKEAFDYMLADENGIFVQEVSAWHDTVGVYYTRYINGYPTPETIHIHLKDRKAHLEWWYGEPLYTQEDAQTTPDISAVMEELDLESIIPPHTENAEAFSVYSCFARGRYIKRAADLEDFGLISVTWYLTDGGYIYYDDLYILISADGSYQTIEREVLAALTGSNEYLHEKAYNTAYWYCDGDEVKLLFP